MSPASSTATTGSASAEQPADSEPVFFWQGPGRERSRAQAVDPLRRTRPRRRQSAVRLDRINKLGADWPYDVLLLQDGTDFQLVTRDAADKILPGIPVGLSAAGLRHHDMFFDAVEKQADPARSSPLPRTAITSGRTRTPRTPGCSVTPRGAGEDIPTAEKFASLASTLRRRLPLDRHLPSLSPAVVLPRTYQRNSIPWSGPAAHAAVRDRVGGKPRDGDGIARVCRSRCGPLRWTAWPTLSPGGRERTVVVFNPLARDRTDVVG